MSGQTEGDVAVLVWLHSGSGLRECWALAMLGQMEGGAVGAGCCSVFYPHAPSPNLFSLLPFLSVIFREGGRRKEGSDGG